ncbi:oligopeptidase B [Ekhidna lutea]|uniref:Proline-specific endopeptidase n=1 Tax=Ekhidna lutea TaxID=447679 RepID=A0A239LGU1_EKHLU|nr:S9 family peptidase [Ekhidna lutea]SNT29132.1 oligopeptidase B [Ekhidna lutea]
MKTIKYLTILAVLAMSCTNKKTEEKPMRPDAPIAAKADTLLKEHGQTRVDPYFWMRLSDEQKRAETPDAHTKEVLAYLNEENDYTKTVMSHTEDLQQKLYDEIVGRIKQTDESVPYLSNGYWYYTRYEEGGEYPIYCRKNGSLDAEEEILIDVNKLAEGYDYYAAGGLNVSPDNKILAFAEDTLSRRIYTIRFKNLETGEMLDDQIINTTGGGAWANDNKTFFYTAKNKVSLLSEKIYRHKLGTEPEVDVMVYHEKDPSYYIGVYKSKSDDFVIIYNSSTLISDYHVLDANNPTGDFQQFIPRDEKAHEYSIAHFEDKWYIVTNRDATNFKLMETSVNDTNESNWKEVIPHRDNVLLEGVELFNEYMVVDERENGLTNLRIINQKSGDEHYLDFGEPAYNAYISTNAEFNTNVLRFGYTSMTTPNSTFDYNMETKEKTLMKQQEVVGGHNPEDYITERVWATARDGEKVPISIVYKKGFEKDGNGPLLQYGYGSYGATIDASFSSVRLSLLDRGFAFAIAHIRGGQLMGRQWYEDGKMFKKMNTFNDFIDCSKFLIEENYTSSEHLYAQGGSAGGLLMGAVVNLAPELYKGVLAAVPFVDVVSTMWDETIPLTTNEFDEWGNPKELESYEYMMSYSPYDNVSAQEYPNMLVTTGLFDSQVQYWEPAKWVAKLRDMKTDNNTLILDTDMEAGHGGASGRFKRYKTTALQYAFLLDLEGIEE